MSDTALSVRDLTVRYGPTLALDQVSLSVPAGSLTAVLGPNGAGKSTLLKAVLGLVVAEAGIIEILGHPFPAVRDRVAFVPQRAAVDWDFPASALDVVLMGLNHRLPLLRPTPRSLKHEAREALDRVGLGDLAGRQIGQLSGGQQQRVFLARALARRADLTLLDEPFAGVDAVTERVIVDLLRSERTAGRTVVAVHHDLGTVADYFDRAVLVAGRLVAQGPVGEVMRPDILERAYGRTVASLQGVLR